MQNKETDQTPWVSIVIPLFNEADVFPQLVQRLNDILNKSPFIMEVVMIDDGSNDGTDRMLAELAMGDERFKALFLSRNFGHQIAVSAGMAHISASKACMIIDGDLQDPPELVFEMFEILTGELEYDVVYAVRKNRKENRIKVGMYFAFYRILNYFSDIYIPYDSGDFALISRKVVDIINLMPERSRFLRGLRSWVGFKQKEFVYDRQERYAGKSKYSFKMLLKLAFDGIYNFSDKPLRMITKLGLGTIMLGLFYFAFILLKRKLGYEVIDGFPSLIMLILFFSGVQLLSIGIIAEYISRIYLESKGRPLYVIQRVIEKKQIVS
jgi:dolichol-phosphate mannosyltransferase